MNRRVVVHAAGDYRQLKIESFEPTAPGPSEVAIAVEAVGINYADCIVRMGLYASARELVGWPITPGFELAGHISAIGDGVQGLRVGDRVVACTLFGAYTSHAVLPEWQVFRAADGISTEQLAAFPATFLTAWYALMHLAHPRPGQQLLVHSAAGGVGSMLVQLAKHLGCKVTAVVGSAHKVAFVEALGADKIIDRSLGDPWMALDAARPEGFDLILDANGADSLREGWKRLRPGGKLLVYGFHTMLPRQGGRPNWVKLAWDWLRTPRFSPLEMTQTNRSVLAFNLSFMEHERELLRTGLETGLEWMKTGVIRPPAVTRFAFDDVAEAHRAIESGTTTGKLVLIL